jgi:recombination protein RecR
MPLSSQLLENAVDQLATLPGIGRRSATRFALELLRREKHEVERFAEAVRALRENVRYCRECCNISDKELCEICSDPRRDRSIICVVEDIRDVIAIENTHQYKGLYHVLGGVISPIDGIGPDQLNSAQLMERVSKGEVKEVVLALGATLEGDTTNFYLYRKLGDPAIPAGGPVKVSMIARGISIGGELEQVDEVTLGRSIADRKPYEQSVKR